MEILLETNKIDQNKVLAQIKKKKFRNIINFEKKKKDRKYFVHIIHKKITNTISQEKKLCKKYERN